MEIEPKYTFVPLTKKNYTRVNDKTTLELLSKWGLKGNFIIQNFSFNEPFQQYHKYHLAEAFFKDNTVSKALLTKRADRWVKQGIEGFTVEIEPVPCSVLSMSFFDKLKDWENGVIYKSGTIRKRYDTEIGGFLVSDNLKGMMLDDECPEYNLYSKDEKNEFIFHIFQMLVLGGILCQHEDILDPYLDTTKAIYKDLIRVRKQNDSGLSVDTIVLKVVARDSRGESYFPYDPHHVQNIGYLLVDGSAREVTTFLHQFGEYCLSQ